MCQTHSGSIGHYIGAIIIALLLGLSSLPVAHAAFVVPANDGFVTDTVGILTPTEKGQMDQELEAYKQQTSNEIAVLVIQSLNGEVLEDASLATLRKWGIGGPKNNGALIFVVYEDHLIRIETGYGLEGPIPDTVAVGIAETDMRPNFRNGEYFKGMEQAIDSIKKHIGGEYTADRYSTQQPFSFSPSLIFVGFILLQWMIVIMSRSKSWWLGGVFGFIGGVVLSILYQFFITIPILIILGLLLDYFVSKNYRTYGPTSWWAGGNGFGGWGSGGGFGGGGGGGGFSGFGGGSGGGGGGSSSW